MPSMSETPVVVAKTIGRKNHSNLASAGSLLFALLVCWHVSLVSSSSGGKNFLGPKIVSLKPSTGVTLVVKSSAIFECQVVSYPLAKISWRKNGKRVSDTGAKSNKFRQSHGSNLSLLRVNDINHSMNITCVAETSSNEAGETQTAEATVQVRTSKSWKNMLKPNKNDNLPIFF